MHHKKSKWKIPLLIISITIVIALIFILYIRQDRNLTKPEAFFKDIIINIEKIITYPFYNQQKKQEENQTESYIIQKNINDTIMKEIEELKKVLELNQTFTDYEIVNSTVISRNRSYWFQNLTIDKGKKAGLEKDMIAITKDGLIGKISKVSNTTSEIKLITTEDANYKISVEVITSSGNIPALLNGFDTKDNTVIIEGVDNNIKVEKGQEVITSGLGGIFPRGIYVGKVERIESDKYGISQKLKVKLKQNFNDIHYVSILKRNIK